MRMAVVLYDGCVVQRSNFLAIDVSDVILNKDVLANAPLIILLILGLLLRTMEVGTLLLLQYSPVTRSVHRGTLALVLVL